MHAAIDASVSCHPWLRFLSSRSRQLASDAGHGVSVVSSITVTVNEQVEVESHFGLPWCCASKPCEEPDVKHRVSVYVNMPGRRPRTLMHRPLRTAKPHGPVQL